MSHLGLQTQAERYLGFLVSERAYRCTITTPYRVRFESPTTFVELVFDCNRSFELGLLIGKIGSANPPFTIAEVLRRRRAPEAECFSLVQITTSEALATWVAKLAHVLRTYGHELLAGNERDFTELAKQRRREVENYALELELRAARAEAERAWRSKDYAAVINALKPLRAALTAAEVRKLEFAEKQLG